ncbi:MAG: Stp1/IreP family PP2C-type Ser/Thr phosphatase [Clostridia bacterium]|nr:Stp1/IreP family PP2C-type Ser/Thr phosphatase [Clostridia bacterium]
MIYFGKTDIGKLRKGNQDNFGIYEIAENALLLAVCDGMGGAAGGEEASRLALEAFYGEIKAVCEPRIEEGRLCREGIDLHILLANAAECANKAVYARASEDPALRGMGTTLVAMLIIDSVAHSINIGDSRMYRISEGKIKQITHDHSYVQYLVDMGRITPEEAKNSTNRNIITRAVGTEQDTQPDIENIDIEDGGGETFFLLCSDGLTSVVSDDEIASVISGSGSLEEKVNLLIEKANQGGGPDNITVVLFKK